MLARVVRHDERVVGVDLHVPPQVRGRALGEGEVPEIDGIPGVRHVDERGAVEAPQDGVLAARLRIHPAPDVADHDPARAPDFACGEEGDEVHLGAVESRHHAVVGARLLLTGDRGQTGLGLVDGGGRAPRPARFAFEYEADPLEELGSGGPDHGEAVAARHGVPHEAHQSPGLGFQHRLLGPLAVVTRVEDVRRAGEGAGAGCSHHEPAGRGGEGVAEEGRRGGRGGCDRAGLGPRPAGVGREAEDGTLRLVAEGGSEVRLSVQEHGGQPGHHAAGRRQPRDLSPCGPGSAEHVTGPGLRRGRRGELAEREGPRGAHEGQIALDAHGRPETGVGRRVRAGEFDRRQAHVGLHVREHGAAGSASRGPDDAELRAGADGDRRTESVPRRGVRRLQLLPEAPGVPFADEDVRSSATLVLLRRAHHEHIAPDGQRLPETVPVRSARGRYGGDLRPTVRAAPEYVDAPGFRTGHRERRELPRPRNEDLIAGDGGRRAEADQRSRGGLARAAGMGLRGRLTRLSRDKKHCDGA